MVKYFLKTQGFTLVELLVSISITTIIGVYIFANYRSFGEEQKLKSAALEVVTFFRLAQSNATSGVKCQGGQTTIGWNIDIDERSHSVLDLYCLYKRDSSTYGGPSKLFTMEPNISITKIVMNEGTAQECEPNTLQFTAISGALTTPTCTDPTAYVEIKLGNSKLPGVEKKVIIETGGRIYAE